MGGCRYGYTKPPTDTSMGCSGIKSNQKGFTLPLILCTVLLSVAHTHTHTPLLTHNILNSQTQNTEKAPSAPPAAFAVPLFIVKKGRRETKKPLRALRIHLHEGKRPICLQSPYEAKGYVYLLKASSKSTLANYEERGRQRLKARTINFPGERVRSAWRARVTFR